MPKRKKTPWTLIALILFLGMSMGIIIGYYYGYASAEVGGEVVLTMAYGSEKRGWIEEVAPLFREWWAVHHPDIGIRLVFTPMGSRESMIQIFTGQMQPVIWSPASSVWIPLLNWLWEKEYGTKIVTSWNSTVVSPVVIATWKSYAVQHNITSVADLYRLAAEPDSGLKYAHTNPLLSNSGFSAMLMEVAAAAHKPAQNLTLDDLANSTVKDLVATLESKAVYYGKSTGFLSSQMIEEGPEGLTVVFIYENLVIEKNLAGEPQARWNDSLVAIYPKDGVVLSDHPFAILNAPWVSQKEAEAAREFVKFLLSPEAQSLASKHGFRPAIAGITPDPDIFNETNGVKFDPNLNILIPPSNGEVLWRLPDVWMATKA